ncbi:hypothetical protein CB0101_12245 [Synechococcus sp. CB0101]|jgi:hypothetical protein|uniref:hypothetical protein n=1 Tax=Synechococcus sp. CB0101 TaxID=232348 RepID=UPI00020012EC|nr:hypothetical protein [Synechococcus sp. CB0101]QCH15587.1 hypothetical protein CB0101_12245 [Synechococcus sp. CB0101]
MTATLTAAPLSLGEPAPGTPEALLLLANAGVLPASSGADDPRFSADSITTCVTRLLEVKQQQELLNAEQKELNEQLRLAHLRGDLLTLLPAGKDGNGYQITPDLVLNRRPGRKQWSYSIDCKEIECQLKARQSYEQQSGLASYSLGAAFWEVRASKG